MRRRTGIAVLGLALVAHIALGSGAAFAKRPDDAPDGSMGVCEDGTISYSREKRGACRENGGVRTWFRQSESAASASAHAGATPTKVDLRKSAAP